MLSQEHMCQALKTLHLSRMAEGFAMQAASNDARGFDERLADLIERELHGRAARQLDKRFAGANLPQSSAALEDVTYRPGRGLHKTTIAGLSDCSWITSAQHLTITGNSGRGKSWLACAFANAALRCGHTVLYRDVPDLLAEWQAADAEGCLSKLRRDLNRTALLVLDDWAVEPLSSEDVLCLRRVLLDRSERRSVMLVSPVAETEWRGWLGGKYIADGLVDRLVHAAHRIELKGLSLR